MKELCYIIICVHVLVYIDLHLMMSKNVTLQFSYIENINTFTLQ